MRYVGSLCPKSYGYLLLRKLGNGFPGFLQLLTKSGFEVGNFFHCAVDFPKLFSQGCSLPPSGSSITGMEGISSTVLRNNIQGSISRAWAITTIVESTGSFSPFSSLANCCGVRPINFAKRYRETPCSIRAARTTSPKGHGVLSVFSLNRHHRLLLGTHGFCRLIHQSSRLHAQRVGEQNQR